MGSPSSSDLRRLAITSLLWALLAAAFAMLGGCATVHPEDKEYLAEPAMTFGSDGPSEADEEHVFNNREGDFGGQGVGGGGCGCN